MGHGRSIINIEDKNVQLKVYKEIIKKELSVRETETLVRKIKENKTHKKTTKNYNEICSGRKYISKLIGSKFKLFHQEKKGKKKYIFNSEIKLYEFIENIKKFKIFFVFNSFLSDISVKKKEKL